VKAISLPGIPAQESGIASAQLNSAQQIGVALGVAVLTTISVSITEYRLPDALTALYTSRASRCTAQGRWFGECDDSLESLTQR